MVFLQTSSLICEQLASGHYVTVPVCHKDSWGFEPCYKISKGTKKTQVSDKNLMNLYHQFAAVLGYNYELEMCLQKWKQTTEYEVVDHMS